MRFSSASLGTFPGKKRRPTLPSFTAALARHVHGQRGLAHRGTGRDDDQVGFLQTVGQLIDRFSYKLQAGDLLAISLIQGVNGLKGCSGQFP